VDPRRAVVISLPGLYDRRGHAVSHRESGVAVVSVSATELQAVGLKSNATESDESSGDKSSRRRRRMESLDGFRSICANSCKTYDDNVTCTSIRTWIGIAAVVARVLELIRSQRPCYQHPGKGVPKRVMATR